MLQYALQQDEFNKFARTCNVVQNAVQREQYLTQHDQLIGQTDALPRDSFQQVHDICRPRYPDQRPFTKEVGHLFPDYPRLADAALLPSHAEGVDGSANSLRIAQEDHQEQQSKTPSVVLAHMAGKGPIE